MKTLSKFALAVVALASLVAMTIGVLKLMDVGTCASGNVIAQQCPDGTGTTILVLTGCIIVFTFSTIAIAFGDFAASAFWFGLLFVVLGGAFLYAAIASDTSGAGVGYIIGPLFLLTGSFPLIFGGKDMVGSIGESDDDVTPSPLATGIRPATGQVNSSGIATGQVNSSGIATGQVNSSGSATGAPTSGADTDDTPTRRGPELSS